MSHNRGPRTPKSNRVVRRRKQHEKLDDVRSEKVHVVPEVHVDEITGQGAMIRIAEEEGTNPLLQSSYRPTQPMMKNIGRRVLISKETVGQHLSQHVVKGYTTPSDIIDDMYSVLGIEVRKYRDKTLDAEEPLNIIDAGIVNSYGTTLAKLVRAEQQLQTNDELDSLTQEQLEYTVFEMSRKAGILTDEQLAIAKGEEDE